MEKRKLVNKKGISLVVAMALSIFLLMITGTFLSVSILQQEGTGSEMNSRQAYVDAKSALHTAEDFLKSEIEAGRLNLPSEKNSIYVVLYYDENGKLCYKPFDTADDAKDFIKNFATNNSGCTLLSDTYIKITNNGGGSYTMSAFSAYDKYTTDSESFGDLSINFTSVTKDEPKKSEIEYTVEFQDDVPDIPPAPNSNGFLMVGAQSSFTLLNSATNEEYKTMNSEMPDLFVPFNESTSKPVNSYFPLVYTKPYKITSNKERCNYCAYNNGIYFIGNSSSEDFVPDIYRNNDNNFNNDPYNLTFAENTGDYKDHKYFPKDVCWVLNNETYGSILNCELVVFRGNVLGRKCDKDSYILQINNYGNKNNGKVIVYLPIGAKFVTYDSNGVVTQCYSYSSGYYTIDSGNDIFSQKLVSADSTQINNIASINMYSEMVDKSTKNGLKDIRSGYEANSIDGSLAVNILGNNATFITNSAAHSDNEKIFSDQKYSDYVEAWKNTSIYCGPAKAPDAIGVYDLYCGESFNFVWNNVQPLILKNEVDINLRSKNIVLTFGIGDAKEYSHKKDNVVINTYNSGNGTAYTSSNVLKQPSDSSAKFTLNPYIGGSTYTLTVMEDMKVEYSGTSYIIRAGKYSGGLKNGLNLFSDEAKDYFEKHQPGTESAANWLDNGKFSTATPVSLEGKSINFAPTSAENPLFNGVYKATILYCDFSNMAINTNNAILSANQVTINAKTLNGNALYLNSETKSCKIDKDTVDGKYLTLDSDITFNNGSETFRMSKGKYFFKGATDEINLMDINKWQNDLYIDSENKYYEITIKTETTVTINEGKYH